MNNTSVSSIAHPSLALIKYWGKEQSTHTNIPATTSIALTLDTLTSEVRIAQSEKNIFCLNGEEQSFDVIALLQSHIQTFHKKIIGQKNNPAIPFCPIRIDASNNFPTASGLASSASGYAALTKALVTFYNIELDDTALSSIARVGSGSAARSIYGGITIWEKGMQYAKQIKDHNYWKELRIIVFAPYIEKKPISSRQAMIDTSRTSPYYSQWIAYNNALVVDALQAISKKDIEKLGVLMRRSYTAMHASSIAAVPSIRYWKAASIGILDVLDSLREQGIPVWETMDAGPQVKIVTLEGNEQYIVDAITTEFSDIWYRVCRLGQGAQIKSQHKNKII